MRYVRLAALGMAAIALSAAVPAFSSAASAATLSSSVLEREFRYGAERFTVTRQDGVTAVRMEGAVDDFRPGRPDLPWVSETVDLPAGQRVVGVEVVAVETAGLAEGARLASTVVPKPGLGAVERSVPDAAYFGRAGWQPEQVVELGAQGYARGQGRAMVRVCPVRWDAVSGRLERVSVVRVRLRLGPAVAGPLARERVVAEWEEGGGAVPGRGGAVPLAALSSPAGPGHEGFAATQVPSLLGSPVEYVIITNETLAGEFQRLAEWKTQSGVPAVVRTVTFIRQQYPRGSDDAERIRDFIRDAYTRWGVKWVLLGGDTDVIPTRLAHTTYQNGEYIACDMYYSCLDGNWDADGDHLYGEGDLGETDPGDRVDLFPDVYVGRAPASTVAEAQRFVDKTFQYTRTPAGNYENTMLLFAEVLFPENWQAGRPTDLDGASLAEELLPSIKHNPSMRYARLYQNYGNPAWEPGALPETRQAVYDSLNRGYGISVHIGHGYRNVMSVGDGNLYNSDVLGLTNGPRLTSLYAIDCTSNAIDFPCIGEAFLRATNGGAVTNIGSTRYDFPYAGRHFENEYFRLVFEDSVTAVGEAQARQKLPLIPYSDYDSAYRWMQFTLLLLGDPETRIWTGLPRTLTVSHAGAMVLGDTTLAVHVAVGGSPLGGARVTAYRAGDAYAVGTAAANGDVTLAFRPDSVGSFTLTVTGYDCRPYQATVAVTAGTKAVLAGQAPTLDDDSAGGTVGNGDGQWDAGETVDVRIPVRNNGSAMATLVQGTLGSGDPLVTLTTPAAGYGTIAPGVTVTPLGAFRISVPYTAPDQREVPFQLRLTDGAGHAWLATMQLVVHAPEIRHFGHAVTDAGGDSDGIPDAGETVTYGVRLKNLGTGQARQVAAKLRSLDGLATVTDSTSSWGTLAAGEEKSGDALVFVVGQVTARLQLSVSDEYGVLFSQVLDLEYPAAPTGLECFGRAGSVQLIWTQSGEADVLGYNVYRSLAAGGPFTRVNAVPTDRIATYEDGPLAPLTRYYYRVTVVDSSGNESVPSAVASVSTNPPLHTVFPIPLSVGTFAPVAVDHVYAGYPLDVVVGADVLYLWHPDGTAPIDADGAGTTNGDFTTVGNNYAGGASIADVDGDGKKEIIGVASDSMRVVVLDQQGRMKPGWPRTIYDGVWSSVAIGDLDNDGQQELLFGAAAVNQTPGNKLYAFRANGTEWMDGDGNPSTTGVFKVLGSAYNFGTPVIADLDANGVRDIIYGGFDGKVNAWRPDGTSLPGFPVQLPGAITASVAAGYLDGSTDTQLDLVVVTGSMGTGPDSLYVITAAGARRAGFPKLVGSGNSLMAPSPALADMNNDGFVDIVVASTNGRLYVYDRNGNIVAPWNGAVFSTVTSAATQASPVVADIDGDGRNDVVIGDETGNLTAFGNDGTVLPGFPIKVDAEIKGAAAVCDCDGDGMTEIIVAGWDKNVYMWDYDYPFSPGLEPPWPQFHHDALRTGLMTNTPFVEVGPSPPEAVAPAALEFAPPAPNPARGGARLAYAVPAGRAGERLEIAVYDLAGRQVRVLARGIARAGRAGAAWDLRDAAGTRVGAGVYFIRLVLGAESRSRKVAILD